MLAKLLFCICFIKILQEKEKTVQKLYKNAVKKDCASVKKKAALQDKEVAGRGEKQTEMGKRSKVFLLRAMFLAGKLYCKEKTGETEKI